MVSPEGKIAQSFVIGDSCPTLQHAKLIEKTLDREVTIVKNQYTNSPWNCKVQSSSTSVQRPHS
jgi:hypothetical protein